MDEDMLFKVPEDERTFFCLSCGYREGKDGMGVLKAIVEGKISPSYAHRQD